MRIGTSTTKVRPTKKNINKIEYLMVGKRGFEPRTPASRTQCSTGLSHFPNVDTYRKKAG